MQKVALYQILLGSIEVGLTHRIGIGTDKNRHMKFGGVLVVEEMEL